MALYETEMEILAAVQTEDAEHLDPLLDLMADTQLQAIQNGLPFFDARLRRAIQRKHGLTVDTL